MSTFPVMDTQIEVAVDWKGAFRSFLEERGSSRRTVEAYLQDMRGFEGWFEGQNGQAFAPELTTSVDLRAYRRWCVDEQNVKSPATWNRRRATLRLFCQFAQKAGYLNYDPFQGVEAWEEEEGAIRWLNEAEYHRFMRQVEQEANTATTDYWRWQALRDRGMVELMIHAGLREGELAALDVEDVTLSERKGDVLIRLGKGDKSRKVPLGVEVRQALRVWLELCGENAGPLFVGKRGNRITTSCIQDRVSEIGARAKMAISPHDLRHTFAKRALDRGVPLTVIQKLMGHARIETTARYTRPGWEDLERAVEGL